MAARDNERRDLIPFYRKALFCPHFDVDCERLLRGLFCKEAKYAKGREIVAEDDEPSSIHMLVDGWAIRYSMLSDGSRQITELLLPGDMFPVNAAMSAASVDGAIAAIRDCTHLKCNADELEKAALKERALSRTLWWLSNRKKNIMRAWITNAGQRDGYARMAHIICEIRARLDQVSDVREDGFDLPLRQQDFADMLGLTSVHVNRMLKQLRESGLISLSQQRLTLVDREGLENLAQFDGSYLTPA